MNNLTNMLRRNLFSSKVIENVVRKFLNNNFTSDSPQSAAHKENCLYFKLPHIAPFSITTQYRIKKFADTFCSNLDIKLVFIPFEIEGWFGIKDHTPAGWRLQVTYTFSCAGCSACYAGETNRYIATRIHEHLSSEKHSQILCTWEVLKIVAPFVQKIVLKFWTLLPQASNWKLRKPCTSFGSSRL